jgi:hypothetical protein
MHFFFSIQFYFFSPQIERKGCSREALIQRDSSGRFASFVAISELLRSCS